MKITCSKKEAEILNRNCKMEHCEFCFLKEVCSDAYGNGATIAHLITIAQEGQDG